MNSYNVKVYLAGQLIYGYSITANTEEEAIEKSKRDFTPTFQIDE